MKRAQIFSIDFVIAMAILTVTIGVTLQTVDLMQKRVQFVESTQTSNPDIIAQNFIAPISGFVPATPYCYMLSNGTNTCDNAFDCRNGFTYVSQRLIKCKAATTGAIIPCVLNIRTCE